MDIVNRIVFVDGEKAFNDLINLGKNIIDKINVADESVYSDFTVIFVNASEIVKSEEDTTNFLASLNNKENFYLIIYSCVGDIKWKPACQKVSEIITKQNLQINWLAEQVDIMNQFSSTTINIDTHFFHEKVAIPQEIKFSHNCSIAVCESLATTKYQFERKPESEYLQRKRICDN